MEIYIFGYWTAVVVALVATFGGFRKKQWLTAAIGVVLLAGCAFVGFIAYALAHCIQCP